MKSQLEVVQVNVGPSMKNIYDFVYEGEKVARVIEEATNIYTIELHVPKGIHYLTNIEITKEEPIAELSNRILELIGAQDTPGIDAESLIQEFLNSCSKAEWNELTLELPDELVVYYQSLYRPYLRRTIEVIKEGIGKDRLTTEHIMASQRIRRYQQIRSQIERHNRSYNLFPDKFGRSLAVELEWLISHLLKINKDEALAKTADLLLDFFSPLSETVKKVCKNNFHVSVQYEIEKDPELMEYHEILTKAGISIIGINSEEHPTVVFRKNGNQVAHIHSSWIKPINENETLYGFKLSIFVPAGEYVINILLGKEPLSFKAFCRTVCQHLGLIPMSSTSQRIFKIFVMDLIVDSDKEIENKKLAAIQVFYRIYLKGIIEHLENHNDLFTSRADKHKVITEYEAIIKQIKDKGILTTVIPNRFASDLKTKYKKLCYQIKGEVECQ